MISCILIVGAASLTSTSMNSASTSSSGTLIPTFLPLPFPAVFFTESLNCFFLSKKLSTSSTLLPIYTKNANTLHASIDSTKQSNHQKEEKRKKERKNTPHRPWNRCRRVCAATPRNPPAPASLPLVEVRWVPWRRGRQRELTMVSFSWHSKIVVVRGKETWRTRNIVSK